MSESKIKELANTLSVDESLRYDLATKLISLSNDLHTSEDCYQPAKPMIVEAGVWLLFCALVWVAMVIFVK